LPVLSSEMVSGRAKASVLFIDLDGQANSSTVLQDERKGGYAADLFETGKLDPLTAEPGITV